MPEGFYYVGSSQKALKHFIKIVTFPNTQNSVKCFAACAELTWTLGRCPWTPLEGLPPVAVARVTPQKSSVFITFCWSTGLCKCVM